MSFQTLWMAFKPGWFSFFQRKTGKRFTFENVVGNCAYVADVYRQHVKGGENQYGFFTGQVTHPYWQRKGQFQSQYRHGWIKVKRVIMDPTRWCFLSEEQPRLCVTETRDPDYDVGMNALKEKLFSEYRRFIPAHDPSKSVKCDQPDLLWKFNGQVDIGRIMWIANRAPGTDAFTDEEERLRIFTWLEQEGYRCFVPLDNRVTDPKAKVKELRDALGLPG